MSALPRRCKAPRRSDPRRCPRHLQYVRGHECAVPGCRSGDPIEAAHVRVGTDGGTGLKPSDKWAIPLCRSHHEEQHRIGEPHFETRHKLNMKAIAQGLWTRSPHRIKHEEKFNECSV